MRTGTSKNRHARGFTLLEVLVALAVIAVSLSAAIQAATSNTMNAAYLRDRTLAHWVAMNRLTELQAQAAWPAPGIQNGREEMAGHDWNWQLAVSATPDADVRRVDIEVRTDADDRDPITHLIGYLGNPQ